MAKKTPGLRKRGGVWHIEKRVKGYGTLRETTGTGDLAEAERYLAHRLEEIRRVTLYGERPKKLFVEAAEKYLVMAKQKAKTEQSFETTKIALGRVLPYIATLPLEEVHDDTLAPFVDDMFESGRSAGTINRSLTVVRRILNLSARKWREGKHTWLATAPLIEFADGEARVAYPLSWDEQTRLFTELPSHLARMALFKVNSGTREEEVCSLRWDWEVQVPELETSVFVIPAGVAKNGRERVVVMNSVARSVVAECRGGHPEYVFTYEGHRVDRMNNSAWRKARSRAGLPQVRVHDLKHTFGHRLRAAGVSLEERKALLGHYDGEITTHYSAPALERMMANAELACDGRPATILRVVRQNSGKQTQAA